MSLSARFAHSTTKKLDGLKHSGTTAWWGARSAKIYGVCKEELHSSDTSLSENDFTEGSISIEAFLDAQTRRSRYYQRLYSLEDCMYAISKGGAISMSFDMFSSVKDAPDGHVQIPKIGENQTGSHTVAVSGYDSSEGKRYFCFANSWGEEWGDRGYGYLPFEYVEQGLVTEIWVMRRGDGLSIGREVSYDLKTSEGNVFTVKRNKFKPLRYSTQILWTYDIYKNKLPIGHMHLSAVSTEVIEIEEFYILTQYQNQKIGAALLKEVEYRLKKGGIKKIIGWIGAQDLILDREEKVTGFFKKNKYRIAVDNSRFRDAFYKYEKDL